MLFTWRTENLCIVFRSWRVSNTFTLLLSLLLIVVLCAGYEAVRDISRRYEARVTKRPEVPVPSKWFPLSQLLCC
jgi:solute carrier family 31 (copper transporter), member 1